MIVDFCAYLGDWPAYELSHRTPEGLLRLMDRCGLGAACVSLASGMLTFDVRESNERLALMVEAHRARLWPLGALDLTTPTWRDDLEDGIGRLGLFGFRLHPNYHGYNLTSPEAVDCAARLAEAGCPLFIALYVDEERFQHPALRVPNVAVDEITQLIQGAPRTTFVLNSLKIEHALPLLESGETMDHVYFDINAMDMPFDGLQSLVNAHGAERLLFGSQMPFLYPEAARMVLEYSGLSSADIHAILEGNWRANPVLAQWEAQHA